jgi:murein DD-endopeptidase MepM/ murein hydrolase activator NlpD
VTAHRRVLAGLLLAVLATGTGGCGSAGSRPVAIPARAPAGHETPPVPSTSPAPPTASPATSPADTLAESPADTLAESPATNPGATPAATGRGAAAPPHYAFPVGAPADYGRTHGEYPATDLFAACGAPVRAVTAGTVGELNRVDRFDPAHSLGADRGGLFVAVVGDDGVRYYAAHLSVVAAGLEPGRRVAAGAPIGQVGHTGNARGICHVHFAISPPCGTGDWWTRRGVVWPWRYLDAWRGGQDLSPAAEVTAWRKVHGCPTTVPPGVS